MASWPLPRARLAIGLKAEGKFSIAPPKLRAQEDQLAIRCTLNSAFRHGQEVAYGPNAARQPGRFSTLDEPPFIDIA